MMKNKSNVIYIDFTFKRKKIKSRLFIALYKLFYTFRRVFSRLFIYNRHGRSNSSLNRKTSNY